MHAVYPISPARLAAWLTVLVAVSVTSSAAPTDIEVVVHLDKPIAHASPLLHGHALPGPGDARAAALVPQLLRNRSFESTPPGTPRPIPKEWAPAAGAAAGWQLLSCGAKRVLVRRALGQGDALLLAPRKRWGRYTLSLIARKTGGPGGLCVLFEVRNAKTHLRWTLGAMGNRYHVLEKVRGGEAERLGTPVVGRIETGRCYRIEVERREKELRFVLNGRLMHHFKDVRMPSGGIGLAGADATAEYFGLAVHGKGKAPRFLLDDPAEATRDTVSTGWEPLRDPRNDVAYDWDSLYPANSHFAQSIKVEKFVAADAGLRQRGLAVQAGKAYRGRVHLRAQGKTAVVVSLRTQGGKVLASQRLAEPAETWNAFEFVLRPSAACPTADFCITATAKGTVWVDQVSLVQEGAATPYKLRADVVKALRRLKPPMLRWPAEAMGYDWRQGIGPVDARHVATCTAAATPSFAPAPNDFGTGEFLALCRHLGAKPVPTVNPQLGLRPALCWLEYCNGEANTLWGKRRAEYGVVEPYGVKQWAVGGLPLGVLDVNRYTRYADDFAKLAAAMREEDPSVQVVPLIVGSQAGGNLVKVEARVSGNAAPARLQAWAARVGDEVAVRLVHLGNAAATATITLKGIAPRRLASHHRHMSIGFGKGADSAKTTPAPVTVQGNTVRLTLLPQTTHAIVVRPHED